MTVCDLPLFSLVSWTCPFGGSPLPSVKRPEQPRGKNHVEHAALPLTGSGHWPHALQSRSGPLGLQPTPKQQAKALSSSEQILCFPPQRGRGCDEVSTNLKEVRNTQRRKTGLSPTEVSVGACGCHGRTWLPALGDVSCAAPNAADGTVVCQKDRESFITGAEERLRQRTQRCLRKPATALLSRSAGFLGLMTKSSELELQKRFLPVYTFLLLEGPTAGPPPP